MLALDCRTGQRTAASGASGPSRRGTRRPSTSGSGPHASGKWRAGLGTSSVRAPGSRRSTAARVEAGRSGSEERASSSEKNITAAGLSGRRPLSLYMRSTASRESGSVASPYTVSAGKRATPPTAVQRSKVWTSAGSTHVTVSLPGYRESGTASVSTKRAPCGSAGSTRIDPPWRSTIRLQIASPSPVPS